MSDQANLHQASIEHSEKEWEDYGRHLQVGGRKLHARTFYQLGFREGAHWRAFNPRDVPKEFDVFPHAQFEAWQKRVEEQDKRPPTIAEAARWVYEFIHGLQRNAVQYSVDMGGPNGDASVLAAIYPSGMVDHYELVKLGSSNQKRDALTSKNEYYAPATMIEKLSKLMNNVNSWWW